MSREEAIRAIDREYRQDAGKYLDVIQKTVGGFLAIFFRDVNANLYVALRQVDFDGHGEIATMHHTNRIL